LLDGRIELEPREATPAGGSRGVSVIR